MLLPTKVWLILEVLRYIINIVAKFVWMCTHIMSSHIKNVKAIDLWIMNSPFVLAYEMFFSYASCKWSIIFYISTLNVELNWSNYCLEASTDKKANIFSSMQYKYIAVSYMLNLCTVCTCCNISFQWSCISFWVTSKFEKFNSLLSFIVVIVQYNKQHLQQTIHKILNYLLFWEDYFLLASNIIIITPNFYQLISVVYEVYMQCISCLSDHLAQLLPQLGIYGTYKWLHPTEYHGMPCNTWANFDAFHGPLSLLCNITKIEKNWHDWNIHPVSCYDHFIPISSNFLHVTHQ